MQYTYSRLLSVQARTMHYISSTHALDHYTSTGINARPGANFPVTSTLVNRGPLLP